MVVREKTKNRGLALITGAASGIGRALASEAAADGYSLLLVDRDEAGLRQSVEDLVDRYPEIPLTALVADLSGDDPVKGILSKIKETGIPVSMIINCAGFGVYGNFHETDWRKEYDMIQVHVHAPTRLIKEILPEMISKGEGYILNVASLAGFVPGPLMAVYYATKAYLISFSRALNAELENTGVSVTVLCPGVTKTGFSGRVHGKTADIANNSMFSGSAETVARFGYQAMKRRKAVAIPGLVNKIMYLFQRLFPLFVVIRMVKRSQQRIGESVKEGLKPVPEK